MRIPLSVRRLFPQSIQHDSEQLRLRLAIAARLQIARNGHIVLVEPPFAYGRQMVVEDALGRRRRIAFDAEQIASQRVAS